MTSVDLLLGDITRLEVDAIVNAANSSLMGGGGVDGAIHRAGGPSILDECREIVRAQGPLSTGNAVVTGAGLLPARHVIHTVGPIWHHVGAEEAVALLGSCYRTSLDLAVRHDCSTIAFPNISTGVYGFPLELAAETAVAAVSGWIAGQPNQLSAVTFVCYEEANHRLYSARLGND